MKNSNVNIKQSNIEFLRFIAVSMVVTFHFFSRWGSYLPFSEISQNIFLKHFYYGVELFFIISGYVIALTLHRSQNLGIFFRNRASRLYPALVLLLPLVYIFQRYIPGSPFVTRSSLQNLFGSITLLPPKLLSKFLQSDFDWLTLVLWSLKVGIFFYILAGCLFFFLRRYDFFFKIHFFGICVSTWYIFSETSESLVPRTKILSAFLDMAQYYCLPWFLIGVFLYQVREMRFKPTYTLVFILYGIMAYLISEPYSKNSLARFIAISLTVMVAITVIKLKHKSRIYEFSTFQKIGSSSYEMYLIHQGIGIPLCIYLFSKWPASPYLGFLATLIAIGLLFLFARTVQIKLTTPINEFLRRKTIS